MHKKHFVFDLDDTLVDGRTFCGEAMARSITHFEPTISYDKVVAFHEKDRGKTIVDLYKEATKEFNLHTPLDDLLAYDGNIQKEEHHRLQLFEGVVDILEILKQNGKTLHICTNRKSESLLPVLQHTGILSYFDTITSCIDMGNKKPEPNCLQTIIDKSGDSKDSFIYFGDSEIDSQFAKNAGVDFIIFDQYMNDRNLFPKLISMFLDKTITLPEKKTKKSKHLMQKVHSISQ
jgi:phosphoglycolate phosphatase